VQLQTGFGAALCAGLVASAASAGVTFSFSSDSNNDGPTFFGEPTGAPGGSNLLMDGADHDASGSVIVGLMVDANGDEPGGGSTFNSIFDFEGVTISYDATDLGSGIWQHQYTMSGSFSFVESGTGAEVLQIDFTNAYFTSFSSGPDASFSLGNAAALQTNAAVDSGLLFTPGAPLVALGIDAADLAASENFAFSLTNMTAAEDPSLPLHLGADGSWQHHWMSEGSFSAAASAIPAPGALALLVCSLFVGFGRKRAA
jgi:hypothetical protein